MFRNPTLLFAALLMSSATAFAVPAANMSMVGGSISLCHVMVRQKRGAVKNGQQVLRLCRMTS